MNYSQYQAAARRTAKSLGLHDALDHMAMGLASDFGELITLVKAHRVYNKPLSRDLVKEEAGDCCWFISYGCDILGLQFADVACHPIEDPAYMPYYHLHDSLEYWAIAGVVVVGEINASILRGLHLGSVSEQVVTQHGLTKLYTCVTQIAIAADLRMYEVFEYNIDKLKLRFPGAYSDADAQARADKS